MLYFWDSVEYESTLGELRHQDDVIELSALGTRALNYFLENPTKLINYDELMEQVWDRIVTENAILQVIRQIRQSYRQIKPDKEIIKTVRGKGFHLDQSIVPSKEKKVALKLIKTKWWLALPIISLSVIAALLLQQNNPLNAKSTNQLVFLSNIQEATQSKKLSSATPAFLSRLLRLAENNHVVSLDRYTDAKTKNQTAQTLWRLNPDLNIVTTQLSELEQKYILSVEMTKGQKGVFKQTFSSEKLSDALIQAAAWINLENTERPLKKALNSLVPKDDYIMESYMRGLAEAEYGNHKKAIDYFNICLNGYSDFHLARMELAKSLSKKGDFDASKAELHTLKSLQINQYMALEVDVELASLEARRGNNEESLALYTNITKNHPLEPQYYLIHMNKSIIDSLVGNYDLALKGLLALDELMDPKIYPSYSAITKVNIGRIYMYQQQLNLSESYFIESIQILEQLNDLQRQGFVHGLLSVYYMKTGQFNLASKAVNQELQIAKKQGNERSIAYAYDTLVELKIAQNLFDEAAEVNQLLEDVATRLGAPYLQMHAAQWATVIALEMGQIEQAKIQIEKMARLVNEMGASQILLNGVHLMKLSLALKTKQLIEAKRLVNLLDQMENKALAQSYFTPLKAQYLAKTAGPKSTIEYLLKRKNIVLEQGDRSTLDDINILIAEQHLSTAPDKTIDLLVGINVNDNNAFPYHWILAQAYSQTGQLEKALLEVNKAKLKYNQRWSIEMQYLLTELAEKI